MFEESAGANQLNRFSRDDLRCGRRRLAKRLQPVTQGAMLGSGRLLLWRDANFVTAALMRRRPGILVHVVGRVPPAQCSHQDEDDRQRGYRLRAESQRT